MTMRWAVSALFFVNGLLVGSWAPKIPVLMERLGITEASAGVIVLGLGLGSICVMPLFGAMVARAGSARAVRLAAWLAAPSMIWISLAPSYWAVAATVVLFGGMVGGMDVAMNANAVAWNARAAGRSCRPVTGSGALGHSRGPPRAAG
ncbi:hypothetical protein [Paracoccus sp. PAMC 22219]|uniref:hypothetical protein n=1 Tax=Paracoccus sp. PAMC 22219 TaxID=1569209 RepID=UPI000AFA568B|nr:hypothetical protein [Paracoccus sp. PAMC 22219]